MTKVSIVIPTYNEERYIAKCLDSLLKQSFKNYEIILIDDGSVDNSVKIIQGYTKKYKNIRLLKQKHGGPGRARNLGAKHAHGDIIVLVDGDMEFDKDYIKNLTEPILKGKKIGTLHTKEYIANPENIWARCWGMKRVDIKPGVKYPIFRAISKKEFLKIGGFDPSTGIFDDSSLTRKSNILAESVEALCYHHNPTTLKETFRQMKWIGGSFITNPEAIIRYIRKFSNFVMPLLFIFILFSILIFLIKPNFLNIIFFLLILTLTIILCLSIKRSIKEHYIKYIYTLPIFYITWLLGFITGILKQIFNLIISGLKDKRFKYRY